MTCVRHSRRHAARIAPALVACALAMLLAGPAAIADAGQALRYSTLDDRVPDAATLEKCVTAANPLERYAIFFGRMSVIPGATGMAMRIGIEEHTRGEAFHAVEAAGTPGLSAWRISEPGVKIFKDVKQVSNLEAPADYRAVVRFRWTDAKGTVIKREVLRTTVCRQPASEAQIGATAPTARMLSR
ncbi:MAG: hypothetical protein WB698_12070 [Solirubrobacteraceae bacterium]